MAANTNRPAPRKGKYGKGVPRPQVWMYPDPDQHRMHLPFLRSRAQANFREEPWELTFEEFYAIWRLDWDNRGRQPDNMCLTRIDSRGPWSIKNCELITRQEQLVRQGQASRGIKRRRRGMDIQKRKSRNA